MGGKIISRLTVGIIALGILLIGMILYWSIAEIFRLTDTTINGVELIAGLRKMNGLTNKLLTTDNLHITYFWWEKASEEFSAAYYAFITSPGLRILLDDQGLLYHYKAFKILSRRALNSTMQIKKDYRILEGMPKHTNRGVLLQPMFEHNKTMTGIALSIREIGDYFSSSYENTITPLVASLQNKSRQNQIRILIVSGILAIGILSVVIVVYIVLKRKEDERMAKILEIENDKNKLESIGLFASGIAHDFNNFLASIIGNISIAKSYVSPQSELAEILDNAEKASRQATGLTEQFLTFATGGSPIKELRAIQGIIRETCAFMLRGSNVRCEHDLPDDLWNAEIDKGKICEVLNNIILNGMQAMPEGGVISIRARNILLPRRNKMQFAPGHYLHISIADTGGGIPEKIGKKIFNPYFTTKSGGSGLGLAVSYSIIKKHHGYIDFESKQGVGTTFHIYLRASLKKVKEEKSMEDTGEHGQGRILLMDDEESIRTTVGRMLRMLGYEPVVAQNGREAIALFREAFENNHRFSAVILDLTIRGGMNGEQVLARLKEINPEVKAIVSSGYSHDDIMSKYKDHGFAGILKKPYTVRDLSRTMAEVCGKTRQAE